MIPLDTPPGTEIICIKVTSDFPSWANHNPLVFGAVYVLQGWGDVYDDDEKRCVPYVILHELPYVEGKQVAFNPKNFCILGPHAPEVEIEDRVEQSLRRLAALAGFEPPYPGYLRCRCTLSKPRGNEK